MSLKTADRPAVLLQTLAVLKLSLTELESEIQAGCQGVVRKVVTTTGRQIRRQRRASFLPDRCDIEVRISRENEWLIEAQQVTNLPSADEIFRQNGRPSDGERTQERIAMMAESLHGAVVQRGETISKVAIAILNRQPEFKARGLPGITPLKMVDVAESMGLHVTTIRRAVFNKSIETPHGKFWLSQFICETSNPVSDLDKD